MTAFIIYCLSTMLTKNLLKLNKALTCIDGYNLNIKVHINSKDEIAQIYHQFNLMTSRIKKLVCDNKEAEEKKRLAEMQTLQAQITPHFLYNTLNTIKFLSALQGTDNIITVSENLSTMLHISLDSRKFITIREELDSVKSYINIQKYRYANKFVSEIFYDDDVLNLYIPKLIIQPIVENALIHGIAPIQREGIITIKIINENGSIRVRIKDNGVGISKAVLDQIASDNLPGEHIGIKNVKTRIRMYFGGNYGLSVSSEIGLYTTVDILVPSINQNESNGKKSIG